MIISRRKIKDKISEERRYYITSIEPNVAFFEKGVRGHWLIESALPAQGEH